MSNGFSYKDAGVDIDAGNEAVQRIKKVVQSTFRPDVLTDIGGFSGLFAFEREKYEKPVLVSGADGVGTKLKIAFLVNKHDTVGIDLVAMCANDILVQGAEPLFFLDYLAMGRLKPEKVEEIVRGVAHGCRLAGCALLGGETAEMPDFYAEGEYDLAGFIVGVVEREKIINGKSVVPGDKIIGLASSGLHSNGFSLVRRVLLDHAGFGVDTLIPELKVPLGEELLRPTIIYVPYILPLLPLFHIKGMAHITGGGIVENVPRILPDKCQAVINKSSWEIPPVFKVIQERGLVEELEMYRTFNMGIGFVLIVSPGETEAVITKLNREGQTAWEIGEVLPGDRREVKLIT